MPRFYHRTLPPKPARPKPVPPRKGRPAAPVASPFSIAQRCRERGKRRSRSGGYFKLIVVFTPCEMVLSSNQRAVTVLVCV
ncbi:hypothetical protein C8C95_4103 [Acidovorax sp. 99]|nr:hypothetical protein C8C95_4103 [Acidovorax sp. 99]